LAAVIFFILSRRKKNWAAKPAERVKTEPVKIESVKTAPVKAEPVKATPVAAPVIITKKTVNLDEEIRQCAYELYLEHGSQDGNTDGDWYSALCDVCAKYESAGYRTYFDGEFWLASLKETKPA